MPEFRGLTIRLGADARPLNSALNSIKSSASAAQKQLALMQKALKFDSTDLAALRARLDLAGDKAQHTATAIRATKTAMSQATEETKRLAASTTDVYSQTQRLRSEYNHVDAELQKIYDSARRVYANQNKLDMKSDEVAEHFKEMKLALSGTGDAAVKAKEELRELLSVAVQTSGIAEKFGKAKGDLEGLMSVYTRLRADQKALNGELSAMNAAKAYREAETGLIAYEAELKEAAMQAARFKSELYAVNGTEGLKEAVSDARRLDSALDRAADSARKMRAAYQHLPGDMEAAVATVRSMRTEEDVLNQKLKATKQIIDTIAKSDGFDKMRASTRNVWLDMERAEEEVAQYDEKLKKANADATELRQRLAEVMRTDGDRSDAFNKMAYQVGEAETKVRALEIQLKAADDKLKKAALAKEFREATEEVIRLKSQIAALGASASKLNRLKQTFQTLRTMGYGLYSTITPALMIAGRYAIQAANDIDSAYRDMRKTVNGTEEQFEHLKQAALDYSQTHVTSADTILEIEAMGGQLGIAAENLEAFATTVSNLDIATNMEADDIAEQLGKMASVIGISVDEYDNFGDSLVRLGNNMPVMEGDIMTITTRFMGMGKIVGMSADEMLAWSAAASATGQKSEAAGSAMQRFVSKMETAVVGGGELLDKFAKVAGMSGEEFAAAFNKDASSAMYAFIEGLGEMQKNGDSVNQMLADLGINNVRDKQLIEGLANQMANGTKESNLLKNALEMSSDAYHGLATTMSDGTVEEAGDAAREAQRKSEGFSGELEMMKNNAKALATELAEGALPYIKMLGDAFEGATTAFKALPDGSKQFLVLLGGIIAAAGPAAIAVGAVGTAVTSIVDMFTTGIGARALEAASGSVGKLRGGIGTLASAIGPAEVTVTKGFAKIGDGATKAQKAVGHIGAHLGAYAVGAAAVVAIIAGWVSLLGKIEERQKAYNKATQEAIDYTDSLASTQEVLKGTTGSLGNENEKLTSNYSKLNDQREKAIEQAGKMVDAWRENEDQAARSSAEVKFYSDKILELSGNCNGNRQKLEELRQAVEKYNELTGSSYEVTGEFSGALNAQTEEIQKNTDAYIANAYAKAYAADLEEAINTQREWQKLYNEASKDFTESYEKYQEGLAKGYDKGVNFDVANSEDYQEWLTAMTNVKNSTVQMQEAMEQLGYSDKEIEQLTNAMMGMEQAAAGDEQAIERMHNTFDKYIAALGDNGMEEFSVAMQGITNDAEQFAAMLSDAGIGVNELAKIGAEGFHNLYDAASGDMSRVDIELALLNAAQIDPKEMHVTEDGIEDAQRKLWKLDLEAGRITDGEHVFVLTEQGIEGVTLSAESADDALEQMADGEYDVEVNANEVVDASEKTQKLYDKLQTLNNASATPSVYLNDYASDGLSNIWSAVDILKNSSATIGIHLNATKSATGNIFPNQTVRAIPRHASGGINGIVAQPTLTNIGWVGEDGAEAILHMRHAGGAVVPLTNRHYVRPFAQAVASEMGSGGTTYNNDYHITVNASGDGDEIARSVTRAIRAQELMRGRR